MTSRWSLKNVADDELFPGLERWTREGRGCEAMMIAHVGEIDSRQLYRERGYPSMHDYVVRALNFSSAAAFNRIGVGRVARRYPRVLDMIAAGELHLSGAKVLAPVLDDENVDHLLDAAARQTKRRIEEIVAAERPRPDVAPTIDEVPESGSESLFPGRVASAPQADPGREYAKVEARAPKRYALTVTISAETHEKLRHAQDLERHAVPDGDVATILDRALGLLIETSMKRQFAVTDTPRKGKERELTPEHGASAETRRTVGERDGYRCTFVAEDGTRCNARAWAQLDHVQPSSRDGLPTEGNMRILCGPHNRLEAERKLGAWVRAIPETKRRERTKRKRTARTATPVEREAFATARAALTTNGFTNRQANAALDAIREVVPANASAEVVVREALRALRPMCREAAMAWNGVALVV